MVMGLFLLILLLCCSAANSFLLVDQQPIPFVASKWVTYYCDTSFTTGAQQGNLRNRLPTKLSQQSSETLKTAAKREQQIRRPWEESYQLILDFRNEHGHCNVPGVYESDPRLGRWVQIQRRAKKKGTLKEDRRTKLESIGFSWDRHQESWKEQYQKLLEYKENHGDTNVPDEWADDKTLAAWVCTQRKYKDYLSDERRSKLENINFSWNMTRPWNGMYQELVAYKEEHGDCNIPWKFSLNPALAAWVHNQRQRKATMSVEQRGKLDAIGFTWANSDTEIFDKQWHGMLDKLDNYRQQHGHCRVPAEWSKDAALGRWVRRQRASYRNGLLSKDREQRLNEIGFVWRLRSGTRSANEERHYQQWLDKYEAVKTFQDEHGHLTIPRSYNSTLAAWIFHQRTRYKQDRLQEDRCVMLEEIGFEWEVQEKMRKEQWQVKYDDIKANMNSTSPVGWISRQTKFLQSQRVAYANGKLKQKRRRLLEDIGFVFEMGKPFFRA